MMSSFCYNIFTTWVLLPDSNYFDTMKTIDMICSMNLVTVTFLEEKYNHYYFMRMWPDQFIFLGLVLVLAEYFRGMILRTGYNHENC